MLGTHTIRSGVVGPSGGGGGGVEPSGGGGALKKTRKLDVPDELVWLTRRAHLYRYPVANAGTRGYRRPSSL